MKEENKQPLSAIVGILLFALGIILPLIGKKIQSDPLQNIGYFVWIIGMLLLSYSLTKFGSKSKEDNGYFKALKIFGKTYLITLPLLFIIPILWLLSIIPFTLVLISFGIILAIWCVVGFKYWTETAKYGNKYINTKWSKLPKKEKRKQIILIIVMIISGLLFWYLTNYVLK
ncbi:MAG: hypothetical protein NTZ73_00015 [Candidatus Diapherotrites archaeon]|nr:hypothetical protein [Candidatus Diapherotrites archaeon]